MNLLEFSKETIHNMSILRGIEYAKYYIHRRSLCYKNYGQIVTSSCHGIQFFENIVKYWDEPDKYLENIKDRIIDKEAIQKGRDYELNFVILIKKNK